MRMHEHIHFPMLLKTIATICLFLLTTLAQSHCQQNNDRTICSRPYEYHCHHHVYNISYPFWGQERPPYCGGGYQFKLNCHDDDNSTTIQIGSQIFEVSYINTTTYTMRLVRTDLARDVCSPLFHYTSLSPTFLLDPQSVHNITIFYNCSSPSSVYSSWGYWPFTCEHDRNDIYHVGEELDYLLQKYPSLNSCEQRFQVPSDASLDSYRNGSVDALKTGLNKGFVVKYTINQECIKCLENGGVCGTDQTAEPEHQFCCNCPRGYNGLDCSHKNPGVEECPAPSAP